MKVHETMTMWTEAETTKCFSNTSWLLMLQCEKGSVSDKLLVHKAVVSDSEIHKADAVSDVRLAGEIYEELDE